MAEQILDKARDVVEGTIDFDGQRRSESYATAALASTGLIAFTVGYALQDIRLCLYITLFGSLLTFLLAVPPWPLYNKNSVKWLPAGSGLKARG